MMFTYMWYCQNFIQSEPTSWELWVIYILANFGDISQFNLSYRRVGNGSSL